MEDLADGVVEHVRRVHPGVRDLDLRRVVALVIGLQGKKIILGSISVQKARPFLTIKNYIFNIQMY